MRLRLSLALWTPCAVCVGIACSTPDVAPSPIEPAHTKPQDAGAGDASTQDAAPPDDDAAVCTDCPDSGLDAAAATWIPATHALIDTAFQVDLAATGQQRLNSIDVVQNVGNMTLSGANHRGIAYLSHEWTSAGYTLFDFISVAEDGTDLAVTYLYCQGADLGYAYTESFLHPLDWEVTTGTCDAVMQSATVQADLPALTVRPTPIDTGITIAGTAITLNAGAGSVELAGKTWDLTPFNTVDCTDCPDGPWYELHCMLERDSEGCFGIVYLFPDQLDSVMLTGVVCLPSLETPSQSYNATWTGAVPPMLPLPPWRLSP